MFEQQVADGLTEPSNSALGIAIPSEVPDWMVEAVEAAEAVEAQESDPPSTPP